MVQYFISNEKTQKIAVYFHKDKKGLSFLKGEI